MGIGTPEKSPISLARSPVILETQLRSAFGLESLPWFTNTDT